MDASGVFREAHRIRVRRLALGALAALTLLGIVSTLFNTTPERTLMGVMSDHLRHEYAAWSALQIGPEIYRKPIQAWSVDARHPHPRHGPHPHNYPPLSLVLFLPFGVLSNLAVLGDGTVHELMVVTFVLAGAAIPIVAYRLWDGGWLIGGVLLLVLAIQGLRWGAKGMFDVVVVLALLGGIYAFGKGQWRRAMLGCTLVLGLHFRAWWIAPVGFAAGVRYIREEGVDGSVLAAGSVVALSAGVAAVLVADGLSAATAVSHWSWDNQFAVTDGSVGPVVVPALAASALTLVVLWGADEDHVTVVAVALAMATVFTLPQWPGWYYLAVLPVLFVVDTLVGRATLAAGFVAMEHVNPIYAGLPAFLSQALSHLV